MTASRPTVYDGSVGDVDSHLALYMINLIKKFN